MNLKILRKCEIETPDAHILLFYLLAVRYEVVCVSNIFFYIFVTRISKHSTILSHTECKSEAHFIILVRYNVFSSYTFIREASLSRILKNLISR